MQVIALQIRKDDSGNLAASIIGSKEFSSKDELLEHMAKTGEFANSTTYILQNLRPIGTNIAGAINSQISALIKGKKLQTLSKNGFHPIVQRIIEGVKPEEFLPREIRFGLLRDAYGWFKPEDVKRPEHEKWSKRKLIEELFTLTRNAVEELKAKAKEKEEAEAEEDIVLDLENPVVENPVVENPVVENPVVENPVAENPVVENPVVENPVVENPVVEKPATKKPATKKPAAKKPATKKPAVKKD